MIRRWEDGDTPAVAKIEADSFTDAWSEESLSASLNSPAFTGFVFCSGQEVVGYVGILCADDAEVALIAVKRQFRRQGIGEELLNSAFECAKQKGCAGMFLEVRISNAPARELYRKMGFNQISTRKKYYEDGEDAAVMYKKL